MRAPPARPPPAAPRWRNCCALLDLPVSGTGQSHRRDCARRRGGLSILARPVPAADSYLDNGATREAAGRHRSRATLLPRVQHQPSTAACTAGYRSARPSWLRRRACHSTALHQRCARRPDRLHPRHHRGDQPRRAKLGTVPSCARATRSSSTTMEHHSNIVPWQLLYERDRHRAEGGAGQRRRTSSTSQPSTRCSTDHPARGDHACVQRARQHQPGDPNSPPTPPVRWCWSTARKPWRTRRWTCRPSAATSTPSRGLKLTAPPASAPCCMAAVAS